MGNATSKNTSANPIRMVVAQNNLAQDQEYCLVCNFLYEQCIFHRVESSQALATQEKAVGRQYDANKPTIGFQSQQEGDCTFMNYQPEDYYHVNHHGNDGISHNTGRKRRAIEEDPSSSLN